jgi:hypothetical protein
LGALRTLHSATTAFRLEPQNLGLDAVHKFLLDIGVHRSGRQGAGMAITAAKQLAGEGVMTGVQRTQFSPPTTDLRMARVATLILGEDHP